MPLCFFARSFNDKKFSSFKKGPVSIKNLDFTLFLSNISFASIVFVISSKQFLPPPALTNTNFLFSASEQLTFSLTSSSDIEQT